MDLVDETAVRASGLFPVGRLDRNTTGVLLLTNDGMLAHRLTHPSYEIEKIYLVRTANPISDAQLEELLRGVELEDGIAKVDRIHKVPGTEAGEVGLSIHEGRNRQIRRMFAALGHDVVRLERIRYAGLTPSGIRRGKWRRLSENEVARLYRAVKL
jgi:23S rRNA pseudouridine2605 synthase